MNREQWLTSVGGLLNAQVFQPVGYEASDFRISVGFPIKGGRPTLSGKVSIGECHSPQSSADNKAQVFISPILCDPIKVIETVAHEMVHVIAGNECGHKGPFKRLAVSIGLTGKMTQTTAGPVLLEKIQAIINEMPEYPHGELTPDTANRKGSRLVKIVCPACDNVARQARKTFDTYGLVCGSCSLTMEIE